MRVHRGGRRLIVLGWHSVGTTWFSPVSRRVALRGLERQFRTLAAGFHVVPLGEALEAMYAARPLPPRAVALTFDDGYRDNLALAGPLLERLGLPATFFLVPSLLDGGRAWWEALAWAFRRTSRPELEWEGERWSLRTPRERSTALAAVSERLKRRRRLAREPTVDDLIDRLAPRGRYVDGLFLDWDGARRLARRPGAEIGSHSRDHAILSEESPESQAGDLAEARRRLEHELDVPAAGLAYPNGTSADYDRYTVRAARAAGHAWAITARTGVNGPDTPPYEIRRAMINHHDGAIGLVRPWPSVMRKAVRGRFG